MEGMVTPWLHGEPFAASLPPYLPIVKAACEREYTAGQVMQPDVVALQDNVMQGTALQGWRGVCSKAREEAARTNLQGTLWKRQQGMKWHSQPHSSPQTKASPQPWKGATTLRFVMWLWGHRLHKSRPGDSL